MSKKSAQRELIELRKAAEAELACREPQMAAQRHPDEELLHELRVQQVELEMQNKALRQAQAALKESHDRYVDLYDSAPIGHLTLTPEAVISDANLAGAELLGKNRRKLLGCHFEQFIAPGGEEQWRSHLLEVLKNGGTHYCEMELQHNSGSSFHAGLNCLCVKTRGKPKAVRVALTDITERKRIEFELREYQGLMRELAALTVASREAEYKHISREVHDELGQLLTALRMDVSLLRIQFGERDPVLMKKIKEILVLVDKAIGGVRNVAANLRPAALDMGIVPAIGWLCDNFSGRAETACTFQVVDPPVGLDDTRTVAIFRIVQESLTNVARYAGASSVEITIGRHGDDIAVEVRDDGRGFDPAAISAKASFGLMGMRERALAVGGRVEIASAPSKGTIVSVRIPASTVEGTL